MQRTFISQCSEVSNYKEEKFHSVVMLLAWISSINGGNWYIGGIIFDTLISVALNMHTNSQTIGCKLITCIYSNQVLKLETKMPQWDIDYAWQIPPAKISWKESDTNFELLPPDA